MSSRTALAAAGLVLAAGIATLLLVLPHGATGAATATASPAPDERGLAAPHLGTEADAGRTGAHAPAEAGARAALASGGSRSGGRVRVVDLAGAAVAGARAAWLDGMERVHPLALDARSTAPRPPAATDGLVVATAPGLAEGAAPVGAEGADVVVVLPAPVALEGRVIEDGGPPERPVHLRFLPVDGDLGPEPLGGAAKAALRDAGVLSSERSLWTDPEGGFRVAGLRPSWTADLYLPYAERLEEDPRAAGIFRHELRVAASDSPLVLRLRKLPVVRGRLVRADDGSPLVGEVLAEATTRGRLGMYAYGTRTDDRGAFEIGIEVTDDALRGPPGERGPSIVMEHLSIRFTPPGESVPFVREVDLVGAVFPLDLGVLRVPCGRRIRVHVVDAGGEPVDGAAVASGLASGRTGADGLVELVAAPEDRVQVLAAGYHLATLPVPDPPADDPLAVRLEPAPLLVIRVPPGTLAGGGTGTLEMAWDRTPFEGGPCRVNDAWWPLPTAVHAALDDLSARPITFESRDPDVPGTIRLRVPASGRLAIAGLRPESPFRLRVVDPLGTLVLERTVVLPDAPGEHVEELSLDGVPEEGATADAGVRTRIEVHVVDPEGDPIPGAAVRFRAGGSERARYECDDRGRLVVRARVTEALDLEAEARGFQQRTVPGAVAPPTDGLDPAPVEIVLSPARDLDVHVTDALGRTLRTGRPSARTETGWSARGAGGPTGELVFEDVPREPLVVTVVVGGATWSRPVSSEETHVDWVLPAHGTLEASLRAVPEIEGGVAELLLRATPLAGAAGPEAGVTPAEVHPAETRTSLWKGLPGPIELRLDLLPGRYRVALELQGKDWQVAGDDRTLGEETVEVVAGETARIER